MFDGRRVIRQPRRRQLNRLRVDGRLRSSSSQPFIVDEELAANRNDGQVELQTAAIEAHLGSAAASVVDGRRDRAIGRPSGQLHNLIWAAIRRARSRSVNGQSKSVPPKLQS